MCVSCSCVFHPQGGTSATGSISLVAQSRQAQCGEHGNARILGPQEAPSWLQEGRALQKTQTINQKSFKNNSNCDLRLILFKAASLHVPVPFLSLSPSGSLHPFSWSCDTKPRNQFVPNPDSLHREKAGVNQLVVFPNHPLLPPWQVAMLLDNISQPPLQQWPLEREWQ